VTVTAHTDEKASRRTSDNDILKLNAMLNATQDPQFNWRNPEKRKRIRIILSL